MRKIIQLHTIDHMGSCNQGRGMTRSMPSSSAGAAAYHGYGKRGGNGGIPKKPAVMILK